MAKDIQCFRYLIFADKFFLSLKSEEALQAFMKTQFQKAGNSNAIIKKNFTSALVLARKGCMAKYSAIRNTLYKWALDHHNKELYKPTEYPLFESLPDHIALFLFDSAGRTTRLNELAEQRKAYQLKRTIEKFVKRHTGPFPEEERCCLLKKYAGVFKQVNGTTSVKAVLPTVKEYATLQKLGEID